MSEQPLPEWATGHTADGTWQVGAQMRTRDGRRTGNGVIVAMDGDFNLEACRISVITDSGNKVVFTPGEVMGHFYHPEWVMDLSKHMGVQKYNDEHPCDHRKAKPVIEAADQQPSDLVGIDAHERMMLIDSTMCSHCNVVAGAACRDSEDQILFPVHRARKDLYDEPF